MGVACMMPESAWLCHNMDELDRWGPDQAQAEWEVASVGFLRMTPPRTCACIFDLLPASVQGRAPCHSTTPPTASPLRLSCPPTSASLACRATVSANMQPAEPQCLFPPLKPPGCRGPSTPALPGTSSQGTGTRCACGATMQQGLGLIPGQPTSVPQPMCQPPRASRKPLSGAGMACV